MRVLFGYWAVVLLLVVVVVACRCCDGFQVVLPQWQHPHSRQWTQRKTQKTAAHSNLLSLLFNALVDVSEYAARDVPTMDGWASACGVQRCDGFQLFSDDGVDIGAVTSVDLPANSPVLYVPNEMILSSYRAMELLGGRIPKAENVLSPKELPVFYLACLVLVEYEKGPDSPWYPWLNALPRQFYNGASMTELCFQCLPPLVASLAIEERNYLRKFLGAVPQIPYLSEETKNNKELCRWAFQVVTTRAIEADDGSGDLRIAPMADMLNHGADPEVMVYYDAEGNCCAQTLRDVPAGSPIRTSYADPTNPSYLFARYGFLDESSPATFCKIMLNNLSNSHEYRDMGYTPERMLFYKDTGEVSPEVWDVLLYQILCAESVDTTRRLFFKAHVDGNYEAKQAIHEDYWAQTQAQLLDHIDGFLHRLDGLSARASGKDVSAHPRIPLILRHNEFVKATFLAVRNRYFGQ